MPTIYRADHVGSLLRPPEVLEAHAARAVPQQGGRVVGQRLRQTRRLTAHESAFLKQHAGGAYKITTPAASYTVARGFKPGVTTQAYPTRADLMRDVVKIVQAEVQALV